MIELRLPSTLTSLCVSAAMVLAGGCDVGQITSPGNGGGDTGGGGSSIDGGTASGGEPDADVGPLQGWCTGQPDRFSFFVTSMDALWRLAGSEPGDLQGGFGGDFGGLAGADTICQTIATATGHGDKTWRAFLSATDDGTGNPVHAIERIGAGPWYDANDRLVASNLAGLTSGPRPDGDPQSVLDLPDECGTPLTAIGDSHDIPTGSGPDGRLASTNPESTCNDWTSSSGEVGSGGVDVMCGHSFPRSGGGGEQWLSDHAVRGCGKGANLVNDGAGSGTCIGCSGGYGAIYCFAL